MTHNHVPHSLILATLTSFALLLLLLAISAPEALAQSNSPDSAYVIRANLPAAAVHDLSIRISIPVGMIFDAQSLSASGAASSPAVNVGSPNDGSAEILVEARYGDVDNKENQDLLLTFRSLVADVEGVENGRALDPIRAELSYKLQSGEERSYSGEMGGVTVIEPDLAIERSFFPASGWSGDEIELTLRISHSAVSTAPAYDVDLRDDLPEWLIYVPGSAEVVSGPAGSGLSGSDGPAWIFSEIDGSWSGEQKVELSYRARIADDVQLTGNLACRADLGWTSTSGENQEERHYTESCERNFMLILNLTNETLSNETLSNETLSNETLSNETLSNETLSNETLSNEAKTNDAKTNETQFDINSNDSGQFYNQTEEGEPDSSIGDNSESISEGNASITKDLEAEPAQLGVSDDEEADDCGSNDTDDIIQMIFNDGIKVNLAFSGSSLGTYSATALIESGESAVDGVTEYQEDSSENSALPESNSTQSPEQAINQTLEEGNQTADTIDAPAIDDEGDGKTNPVDAKVEGQPDPQTDLSEPAVDQSDASVISDDEIDPDVELSEAEKVTPEADGSGDS